MTDPSPDPTPLSPEAEQSSAAETPASKAPSSPEAKPRHDHSHDHTMPNANSLEIIVRPLPKIIFFYPIWIVSMLFALFPEPGTLSGQLWMGIFFFNLLVIAADFNEERSLIMGLTGVATVLALLYFDVLGAVGGWFAGLQPVMNQTFYALIFGGLSLIYLLVWIRSRFDYWTFRPNEVVYRYGLFPKMKRYSTENLRWDKEVPDVLERLLAGSGRIILTTPHERHPVIIEHIVRIGKIDDQIADLLGVKAVVHTDPKGR
jgi:hypothetical protein